MYSYRLQVFHAVATSGSFSRAAREILHISQPAVSKHVQALETALGVMLVQRVGKQVILTEAGRLVQQYAEQVLGLAQETQRGTLRLGASSTPGIYLLPPVYPGMTLALEIANSQRVVDGVLARQWDLGMIGIPLEHPQLQVQPSWRDTLVLIVPPHHPLATRSAVTLADLVGETWMFREAGSASGQVVKGVRNGAHRVQDHTLVLQGSAGVKQAVRAGLGMAMVSRFAITLEVQQGVLRVLPITDVQAERDLCLIWRHDSPLPAAVRAFLEVLHARAPAS